MHRILFLLLILFFSNNAYSADWQKVRLIYENGIEKDVQLRFPINSFKSSIKIKDEDGKKEKLNINLLSELWLYGEGETVFLFKKIQMLRYDHLIKNVSKTHRPSWGYEIKSNEKMTLYAFGPTIVYDSKTNAIIIVIGGNGFEALYAFKRPNEKKGATIVRSITSGTITIGRKAFYRKCLAAYLSDDLDLAKKVLNKEFDKKNIEMVFDEYCD